MANGVSGRTLLWKPLYICASEARFLVESPRATLGQSRGGRERDVGATIIANVIVIVVNVTDVRVSHVGFSRDFSIITNWNEDRTNG